MNFTFNGVSAADMGLVVLDGIRRDMLMALAPITLSVPGRDGVYIAGQRRGERVIEIPVALNGLTRAGAATAVRSLAEWLVYPDPAPLILSDETDKTYYAMLYDQTALTEIVNWRTGTLKFYAADPYAYAVSATRQAMTMGDNTLENGGNADTYPIYRFKLKQTDGGSIAGSTFLSLKHAATNAEILCGVPDSVDETAGSPATSQLFEDGDSMDGWSTGSLCEGGTATGTMVSNGSTLSPIWTGGSFGTGVAWHGPCIIKSLTAPATDFEFAASAGFQTGAVDQMGRLEIFFLDSSSAVVARVCLADAWSAYKQAVWETRLGPIAGPSRVLYSAAKTYGWTDMGGNFVCYLKLSRIGDRWTTSIRRWNWVNKRYEYVDACSIVDDGYSADIAAVAVTMSAWGTHTALSYLWLNSISVTEPAVLGSAVPFVFFPGDEIMIDTSTALVTRIASANGNDGSMMEHMDITSQFFGLTPGGNTVTLSCGQDIEIDTDYTDNGAWVQERWL